MRRYDTALVFALIPLVLVVGWAALLIFLWGVSAWKGKRYLDGLDEARASAPYVSDFVRLFPNADVRNPYFSPGPGPGYDLFVVLHDRYELTMQLPVSFDWRGRNVIGYGEPNFYLREVEKVEDGGVWHNTSRERRFGSADWKKIVDSRGDFGAIGYAMIKDQPVPGLKELRTPVQGPPFPNKPSP